MSPYRSHRLVAMVDRHGHLTDDPADCVKGELEVTHHDDSHEHVLFLVPTREGPNRLP